MKKLFATLVLMVGMLSLSAQSLDCPKVTVDGTEYYSYTVQPKDGLFAIARKFGVTQADLHAANPKLTDGLQIGQVILVPINENQTAAEEYVVHEVQPKETIYGLTRKYNVSVDALVKVNPELTQGLKVGQKLRIPKHTIAENTEVAKVSQTAENQQVTTEKTAVSTQRTHEVKAKETPYSISRAYGITVEELVEANNITSTIHVGDVLVIPSKDDELASTEKSEKSKEKTVAQVVDDQIDTIEKSAVVVENSDPAAIEQKAVSVAPANALKVAVLMPFMLKTPYIDSSVNYFWEFYRGMLLGLEDVKRLGLSVEVHVYDIEKSLETLDSVLQRPELAEMDLILGPAYANQVALVADFAKQHQIYTFVPFTSKIENANEYILQFNPSQEKILPAVAQTIAKRFSSQNIVIARISDKRDKANLLADELTKVLHKMRRSYKEIRLSADNVDTLQTIVGRNRTLLLIATPHAEVVAPILPKIKELNLPFLQIWGFEDWKQWTSYIDGTYYHSLFYRNHTEVYEQNYTLWFGNHTVDTEPHYDLIGYDAINYLGAAFEANRHNPTAAFGKVNCHCLQTDFDFKKSADGQWINESWHLFGFYNQKLNEIK